MIEIDASPQTIVIMRESVADLWDEIMPLFENEWKEMPQREGALDFDRDLYEFLEMNGSAHLFTVRQNAALIGYAAWFVVPNLWQKGMLEAICHAIYLVPEHRLGWTCAKLIRACERELLEGFPICMFHLHALGRREGILFERLGYTLAQREYEKKVN